MSLFISRTPFRISFFGGGTDYPSWYLREGGAVLSTSIDKYCYITCRFLPPFFPNAYRVVWSHIETVSHISEILHPAVREGLRMLGFESLRGVEVHHQGDLPARSGMGSSSAFANGLLMALSALKDEHLTKSEVFAKAIELEQIRLKDNVGSQDQVATAVGGMNIIRFNRNGSIVVDPLQVAPERKAALNDHLMLFFAGTTRLSSEVAGQIIRNIDDRRAELRQMYDMVGRAADILCGNAPLDDFGAMLHEAWELKRCLAPGISNGIVDDIYARARAAGAIGGKLLGAGSSGFMLFYVPPERQQAMRAALSQHLNVPFRFEDEGCIMVKNGEKLAV